MKSARPGDLTISGGRRKRRRATIGIWITMLAFVIVVVVLTRGGI
jgi:predicted nucleic acid-binding Zn ribbon protein